jgi:hypothetical protein
MTDWPILAIHGTWILGLSIILAELGWQDWLARETDRPWRDLFKKRSSRFTWTSGMFLSCVGWGFAQADRWWEETCFFVLAALFGWRMIVAVVQAARTRQNRRGTSGHQVGDPAE